MGRGRERAALVCSVDQRSRLATPVGQVVRRRQNQSLLQLRRSSRLRRKEEQSRHSVGGRAGRDAQADLWRASSRSPEIRQCAQRLGRSQGRPGRGVHGHDAGAGHCAAGVRAHWRGALRHLWRIRGQRAGRPHQRCIVRCGHYPGWIISPRAGGTSQGGRRRSPGQLPDGKACGCVSPHRLGGRT